MRVWMPSTGGSARWQGTLSERVPLVEPVTGAIGRPGGGMYLHLGGPRGSVVRRIVEHYSQSLPRSRSHPQAVRKTQDFPRCAELDSDHGMKTASLVDEPISRYGYGGLPRPDDRSAHIWERREVYLAAEGESI